MSSPELRTLYEATFAKSGRGVGKNLMEADLLDREFGEVAA